MIPFPYNACLYAALAAFATTFLVTPLWRKWCHHTGLLDDPGHRKIHSHPIALAGGLAVMTGLVIPLALGAFILFYTPLFDKQTIALLQHGFNRRVIELAGIILGAFGMLLLGVWDDRFELSPPVKFAGQLLAALLVAACGTRVTLFVPNVLFSYFITVLWILTVVNAFNFMDNMNGLCAGLGALAAIYIGLFAIEYGQYLVAAIAFLTTGALLGFLPYNFPKASAFLGDAGSHLVGYLLAILAILPHYYTPKHPHILAIFAPLLILAVPLGDLVWVVILRWKLGKPFYMGDTNHISHRLVRAGFSPVKAVILIWLLAAALGALTLL